MTTARDLLAAATPRPWSVDEFGIYTEAGIVGDALTDADTALIVAAVNEYEPLTVLEEYVRSSGIAFHLGTRSEVAVGDALAQLDALRNPS